MYGYLNMSRSASFFESGIGRMGFLIPCWTYLFLHDADRSKTTCFDAATQFEDGSISSIPTSTKQGNSDIGSGLNGVLFVDCTVALILKTGD